MNGTLAQVIQFRTRSTGYGWVVMGFLWAVNLLIPLAAVSLGIMLPPMTEELGISPIQAGLLGASWFLGSALVSLPASIWLSRFSPKWVTFYSTFLAGVLLLVQGWAPSFGVLLFARFIFVIVVVCRVQAEVLLVHQWFTQARVAVVMSLTIGIMSIGQLAAVGLIPILMDMFSGWRNVYMGLGGGLLVGAALWMVVGRERVTPNAPETERARGASPLRVLRRYRFLWVLAAAPSGAALAWGALMTFWPTLALDKPGTLAEGRGRPHDAVSRGRHRRLFPGGASLRPRGAPQALPVGARITPAAHLHCALHYRDRRCCRYPAAGCRVERHGCPSSESSPSTSTSRRGRRP